MFIFIELFMYVKDWIWNIYVWFKRIYILLDSFKQFLAFKQYPGYNIQCQCVSSIAY